MISRFHLRSSVTLIRRTVLGLPLVLGLTSLSTSARATGEFPGEIAGHEALDYEAPCSICHIKGNTGSSTPIMPFALSLRARGLSDQRGSLATALDRLDAEHVDSDGDGATDIDELKRGTDPNSSANASIKNDQEAGFGCGGTAPSGHDGLGAASAVVLSWLLLRRRRGV